MPKRKKEKSSRHKKEKKEALMTGGADIGSHNIRGVVLRNGQVIDEIKSPCTLINALSDNWILSEASVQRAEITLRDIAAMFRHHGVSPRDARLLATEAARDLRDADTPESRAILRRIRLAAGEYPFTIISRDKEAGWIRRGGRKELLRTHKPEVQALLRKFKDVTIAHLGGGSLELVFMRAGRKVTLPLGVLKLGKIRAENPQNPEAVRVTCAKALNENWPEGGQSVLAVGGGIWRRVAELVCKRCKTVLSRKEAEAALIPLVGRDEAYFRGLKHVGDRAPYMAASAQQLLDLITYVGAKEIIFLRDKMVVDIGSSMHQKALARQRVACAPIKSASPRPFAPSSQEPPLPA